MIIETATHDEPFYSTYARILMSVWSNLVSLIQEYGLGLPESELEAASKALKTKPMAFPSLEQCRESIYNTSGSLKQIFHFAVKFLKTNKKNNIQLDLINDKLMRNLQKIDKAIDDASKKGDVATATTAKLEEYFNILDKQQKELSNLVSKTNTCSEHMNDFIDKCRSEWQENEAKYYKELLRSLEKDLGVEFSEKEKQTLFGRPLKSRLALLSELEGETEFAAIAERKKEKMDIFELRARAMLAEYKKRAATAANILQKSNSIVKDIEHKRQNAENLLFAAWKRNYATLHADLVTLIAQAKRFLGQVSEEEKKLIALPEEVRAPKPPTIRAKLPEDKI